MIQHCIPGKEPNGTTWSTLGSFTAALCLAKKRPVFIANASVYLMSKHKVVLKWVTRREKICRRNGPGAAPPGFPVVVPTNFPPVSICVHVKCCSSKKKWHLIKDCILRETIFPDTQWPFKPDWGEGCVWGVWTFNRPVPAGLLCLPGQIFVFFFFILLLCHKGAFCMQSRPCCQTWTFANQFVCEESGRVHWSERWLRVGQTSPLFVTSQSGTLLTWMQKGAFAVDCCHLFAKSKTVRENLLGHWIGLYYKPGPVHAYSEVSSTEFSGTYFQGSVHRIAVIKVQNARFSRKDIGSDISTGFSAWN